MTSIMDSPTQPTEALPAGFHVTGYSGTELPEDMGEGCNVTCWQASFFSSRTFFFPLCIVIAFGEVLGR